MYHDRRRIFTIACLLISTLARAQAENSRKSRAINNRVDGPLPIRRTNSIQTDDRDHNRESSSMDYSIKPNYAERSYVPYANAITPEVNDDSREFHEDEEKLFRAIMSKDYHVSSPMDMENFDRIGELMIARANITEEAKRVVRQVKRERPGVFWTLARVAFETVNETRSAIQQISNLVGANVEPETPTAGGGTGAAVLSTTTERVTTTSGGVNSTDSTTTTTEAPYKFTASGLVRILRRNFRGLVRLFNIEWQDALNQSQTNVREFQRDLGNRIGPFLQDNPDVL